MELLVMIKKKIHKTSTLYAQKTSPYPDQMRIFLASPSDVDKYRKATIEIIEQLNSPHMHRQGNIPYFMYTWEESKTPGYTKNYQQDIFTEFGEWCDVFILLLWHKIGQGGTEKEYTMFEKKFKALNPDIKLIVVNIHEKVSPKDIDTEQLTRLRSFLQKNEKNWAPLGNIRGEIKSVTKYINLLRQELNYLSK